MNVKGKFFSRFMAMALSISLGMTPVSSLAANGAPPMDTSERILPYNPMTDDPLNPNMPFGISQENSEDTLIPDTESRAESEEPVQEPGTIEYAQNDEPMVISSDEPHHSDDGSAVLIMTESFDSMPEGGGGLGNGKWSYAGPVQNRNITDDNALRLIGDSTNVYARYEIPTANQSSLMTASFRVRLDGLAATSKMVSFGFLSGGTSQANETHKLVLTDGTGLFRYRNAGQPPESLSLVSGGTLALVSGQWYDFTIVAAANAPALGTKAGTCDLYMGDTLVHTVTAANLPASDVFRSFFFKIDSGSSSDLKVSIDDLSIWEGVKTPEEGTVEPPAPIAGAAILVELDKPIAVLSAGKTAVIVPRVTYNAQAIDNGWEKYDKNVSYFSDNESVATVDSNGLVTAVGSGFASIKVASTLTPEIYETYKVYVDQTSPGEASLGDGSPAFLFYNNPEDRLEKSTWKLQLPLVRYNESGSETGVVEKQAEELQNGYQSEFFYLDEDDWLSFWCPVEGGKTANTSYARSELREMLDPDNTSVNWGWEGTHIMEVTQKVEKVPIKASNAAAVKYGETIISQIHGIEKDGSNANPLIKVRYQYNYSTNTGDVMLELKLGTDKTAGDDKPLFTNVPLGQEFTTVIKVIDNVLYCTISTVDEGSGYREETFVHEFVDMDYRWSDLLGYYKAGNYIQDNSIENHFGDGPTHGEGALVKIKPGSLTVYHSNEVDTIPITGLGLERTSASVALGDTIKLTPKFTPEDTTQKKLNWEVVSGSGYVAVAQDGTVLGISEGTAVVKAASAEDSSLFATCTVTVVGGMPISNGIPIYQSDFESLPLGAKENEIPQWSLTPEVPDGSAMLSEINGIKAIRVYDNTAAVGLGALLEFPEQDDTMTIQFKAMMEDIYSNAPANRENGTVSKMYIGVGVSANGTTLPDAQQTYRIRNNGTTLSGGTANRQYWQPTNNGVSGYSAAQENADKADFILGEWKDITYVITPDNGSPYQNTTRVYIDGYYIGTYLNHVGIGKSDFSKLSHFRFYTGSADAMTAWINDVKVYSGAMIPTPVSSVPIESFEIAPAPSKISVGDTFQLIPAIMPENAIQDVTFRVISGTAALVSENGLVMGVREGIATIEMISKIDTSKKAVCTIEVVAAMVGVTKIELQSRSIHILAGNKHRLEPTFIPSNAAEKGLSYTILSGSDVISVSRTGEVTALKPGMASLQLTSLNNPRATTDCTILVTKSAVSTPVLLYRENFGTDAPASLNRNPSILPYWGINLDGNTTQNTSVTVESISADNYALKLTDRNPGGQPTAMLKFEPTSSPVTFNFKMMIEDDKRDAGDNVSAARVSVGAGSIGSAKAQTFVLKSTGTFAGDTITDRRYQYPAIADNNGTIVYRDLTGTSYQPNEWNSVKLVVTPGDGSIKANTTDIYINGTKVATVDNLNSQSVVDGIQFHAENQSLVTYWIDDVEVWAGEYLGDISIEEEIVTVSFDGNGGRGIMTSISVVKGESYYLPNSAFTRAGYRFGGWKIDSIDSLLPVGSLITVDDDIVLYAQWTADKSEFSGISGISGVPSRSSNLSRRPADTWRVEKPTDKPTLSVQSLSNKPDENGQLSMTITKKMVQSGITQAKGCSAGRESYGVAIAFENMEKDVKNLSASIEAGAIDYLVSQEVKKFTIQSDIFYITLDEKAIKSLDTQSNGNITVTITPFKTDGAAYTAIGSRPVFHIAFTDSKATVISSFENGSLAKGIKYTVNDNEKSSDLFVVKIVDQEPQWITDSSYENGWMVWSSNSNSVYGVGYKAETSAAKSKDH